MEFTIFESSVDAKIENGSLAECLDHGLQEEGLDEIIVGIDGDLTTVEPSELETSKDDLQNSEGSFESNSDEPGSDESMSVAKSLTSSEEDDVAVIEEFDDRVIDLLSIDEDEEPKRPIRSYHEAEDLTPVPTIEVTLQPHDQMLLVGTISSILSNRVIVEGSVKHSPLDEGSILWFTESRLPLGLVDEIFGPVKNPYYIVRYNSEDEVPVGAVGGATISFVPEFANQILNEKNLLKKGYDASGENDEETDDEEFSDDEKEAEYRKSLRDEKKAKQEENGFERKKKAAFMSPRVPQKNIQRQQACAPLPMDPPRYAPPLQTPWISSPAAANTDPMPSFGTQFSPLMQTPNYFTNPSHNAPWSPGFPPQLQNSGLQGEFPAQLQNQNLIFNNLVNMIAIQQLLQPFVPHQGAMPVHPPLMQNSFAPFPFNNGFNDVVGMSGMNVEQIQGQVPMPFDSSMQFNTGSASSSMQFNAGSSTSFVQLNGENNRSPGRTPFQRGGGRFYGRGGGRFHGRGGRQPNR